MRHLLIGATGALLLALGVACAVPAPTPTPAPPTATPTPVRPTATPTPQVKEASALVKGAEEAMKNVRSVKMRGQITFTAVGTPVPGMPTGTQVMSGEFSLPNSHQVMGDIEIYNVDKVIYFKSGKDQPWQKLPMEAVGGAVDEPSTIFKDLGNIVSVGVEPCPRGGLCQVITGSKTGSQGEKETLKVWVGLVDSLVYKMEMVSTAPTAKTEVSVEFYDYNVPVTITAPIP